ncbi:hypothetical protein [Mesonia aestuariivivens]|uniref:Uncharacterized protein n=1 Tax=Mesonia aestuariivivens TaxID=2796128 RepID=A0ABS6W232_9FLAO|nr:hypothetical protein [Mesonia aestuariivivens]MBW2961906.1 hypothetical protein [Mesonia aestuariivivens]
MDKLDVIKANIQRWNTIRNSEKSINYLTSGCGFSISLKDFNNWNYHKPEFINCYLAIDEKDKFQLFLVDNLSDQKQNYSDGNLIVKDFEKFFPQNPKSNGHLINASLTTNEGDQRITTWTLCAKDWVAHKQALRNNKQTITQGEMVQVFTIPFSDLKDLFSDKSTESLKATFALKPFESEEIKSYELEIILAKTEIENKSLTEVSLVRETFADMSIGYPPNKISKNKFNLLSRN